MNKRQRKRDACWYAAGLLRANLKTLDRPLRPGASDEEDARFEETMYEVVHELERRGWINNGS